MFLPSAGFTTIGDDEYRLESTGQYVEIGYKPIDNEPFTALLKVTLDDNFSRFTIDTSNSLDPFFQIDQEFTITCIATTGSQVAPFPIARNTDEISGLKIDIHQLTSTNGVSIAPLYSGSVAVAVAGVQFQLGTLYFNNPDTRTTVNAQVEMQGTADLSTVGSLAKDMKADVGGTNYVVADASGVTLTGLKVTKTLPKDAEFKGFKINGSVSVEYASQGNTWTISGAVTVTNQADIFGKSALDNVTAGLDLAFSVSKDGVAFVGGGFQIAGAFQIGELEVASSTSQPVSFQYNRLADQFEVGGALTMTFNSQTLTLNLGSSTVAGPGIIIQGGALTQFDGYIAGNLTLFGVQFATPGLTFAYQAASGSNPSEFQLYGSLTVTLPGSSGTAITASLGTQQIPGIVIQGGSLTQLNIGLDTNQAFSIFGFSVITHDARVEWQEDDNSYLISGDFGADFKIFKGAFQLGDNPQDGLVIKNGAWSLKEAKVVLQDIRFGAFTLQSLSVEWQETPQLALPFTITVSGQVVTPGDIEVDATLQLVNGIPNYIGLSYFNPTGIPIGDTGAFLTELSGSLNNLDDPANLVVTAHMALIYGEQFSLLGTDVNLFRASGDITVDANHLILDGRVQLGAYSQDNGKTWNSVAGEGDVRLNFDWANQLYNVHLEVDGFFAIFDLNGDLTIHAGQEVDFLATATVVIPPEIPFIGGDTLGGFGLFFQHIIPHGNVPASTTIAAWIDIQIIWQVEVGFEAVYDAAGNVKYSVIGKDQIDNFVRQAEAPINQTFTYTIDLSDLVPANSTYLTYSVDWAQPSPGVTIVGRPTFTVVHTVDGTSTKTEEADFAGTNIKVITDPTLDTPTTKALQIVGSTTNSYAALVGDYKLMVSFTATGGNPFPNFAKQTRATLVDYPDQLKIGVTHELPLPTFGPLQATAPFAIAVPATPAGTFSVKLNGNMDTGFLGAAKVNVYRVLDGDPFQTPVLVGTAVPVRSTAPGTNWEATVNVPIEGLYPVPYRLYASVNDGTNTPTKSALSATFTPVFAVQGNIANQTFHGQGGWSVFLDYNLNGVFEPNEPILQTNSSGFYGFVPKFTNGFGRDAVPVGKPFDVRVIVPSDDFVLAPPVATVTYDGQNTVSVNFTANERSAIKGAVFVDTGGNGNAVDGRPVGGATVYIDANGNNLRDDGEQTALTDASGNYALHGVQPGSYTVRYQPTAGTAFAAVSAPVGTPGTSQAGAFTFGNGFAANQTIEITTLGVFADGATGGVRQPLTAVLYDAKTQQVMASLVFTPQDSGTASGGYFFKTLATPIRVYAGFQGIIAAYGFGPNQRAGDAAYLPSGTPWTTSNGFGLINFTGQSYSPVPGLYPSIVDTAVGAKLYAAGSFQFRTPAPALTSPASGSYSVTIDTSGFDLAERNDFALRAPSSVTGTITTQVGAGGAPSPSSGVVVDLYSGGVVVGSAKTDISGNYTIGGLDPGNYAVVQETPSGSRQAAPASGGYVLTTPTLGGADVFALPALYRQAGLVPFDFVLGDFDGSGSPQVAMLATAPAADYSVPTPLVFVYSQGNNHTPAVLLSGGSHTSVPVGIAASVTGSEIVVLYQDGSYDAYTRVNGQWTVQSGSLDRIFTGLVTTYNAIVGTVVDGRPQFIIGAVGPIMVDGILSATIPGTTGTIRVINAPIPGKVASRIVLAGQTSSSRDLYVAYTGGQSVLYQATTNDFGLYSNTRIPDYNGVPAGPSHLVAADINGDGLTDLGDVAFPGLFKFALQSAGGVYRTGPDINTLATAPGESLLVDVNGDGRPDLVTLSDGAGSARALIVALNTGSGPFWFQGTDSQQSYALAGDPAQQGSFLIRDLGANADGTYNLAVLDGKQGLVQIIRIRAASPITLSADQALTLNFTDIVAPQRDVRLDISPRVGSGNYTVAIQNGHLVVSDGDLGRVLYKPLGEVDSLTIAAPDGRPVTLTIDASGGPIFLPGGIRFAGSASASNQIILIGGPGDDVFSVGAGIASLNGQTLLVWTNLDHMLLVGGGGADRFVVTGNPGAHGRVTLDGGPGANAYEFAAIGTNFTVVDSTNRGTLDFHNGTAGVTLDLGLAQGQIQAVGLGGGTLSLFGLISDVIGTAYADVIRGNVLNNVIRGLGGDDVIYGNGGNDLLDGGDGNDTIIAGAGNSILLGGPGDDLLIAGRGRNLLIGGAGRDTLISDSRSQGGNILIPDETAYDGDEAALRAIMAEWTSRRPRIARIRNLLNRRPMRRRLNGSVLLRRKMIKRDHSVDLVVGQRRYDWVRPAWRGDRPALLREKP